MKFVFTNHLDNFLSGDSSEDRERAISFDSLLVTKQQQNEKNKWNKIHLLCILDKERDMWIDTDCAILIAIQKIS